MATRTGTTSAKSDKSTTKQAVAEPPAPTRKRSAVPRPGLVSAADRERYISEAAYFKAERRGFAEGGDLEDWMEAEAEIDALLDSRGAG